MSIPEVSIEQIKAARALLRWSQADLAEASGVSLPTIKRLEAASGRIGGRSATSAAILSALQAGGIRFTEHTGVQLLPKRDEWEEYADA
uniref:Putative transcriptional regulator, XRE family n=1 Tax=Cereibacter sphaeroides (strain ATCC 17025 / ATH 2.4.3) TaxID=349102 RepID=A4WNS9_CERS5